MIKGFIVVVSSLVLAGISSAQSALICQLAPGVNPSAVATKYKITLLDTTAGAPFAYYGVASRAAGDLIQQQMIGDPSIVWAEDDAGLIVPETEAAKKVLQKGSTLPAVGDRYALYTQNTAVLTQINFSQTLAQAPGRTVRVAILDTGLSPNQPQLWSKVDASFNAIESNLPAYDVPRGQDTNKDKVFDKMTGHGTMVAGIIDQISPQSRFVIARVANSDGYSSGWSLIKGLAFAVTSGAEVANVSLGTLERVPALSDVMDWCESKRLLVVAAIGNNGVRDACFPARISKVVCVSGLMPNNTKAPFSNWDGHCDAAGPATGIVSQFWDGTFAMWSGTSFSTPMATAVAADALRRTSGPLSPAEVRDGFQRFGTYIDGINKKYKGELGRLLDYTRFVQGLRQPRP